MTFSEFLTKASFEHQMSGGNLDSYSNYIGDDWAGWLCGPSKSRDADLMALSNFDAALDMLGGELDGQVEIRSCSHWACGWFDQIMVKANSSKAKQLFEIKKLLDEYPLLDDSDYSGRQYEAAVEYANQEADSVAETLCNLFGLPKELAETQEMLDLCRALNIEHQLANGEDSALMNNQYHVENFDERCAMDFEQALKDIGYNYSENQAFQLISACFGIETK